MAAQLFRRSPHAVEMAIDNTVIVVDPSTNQMLTLNSVAGLVWGALETPTDLDGLVEICAAEFPGVDENRIRGDVAAFVEEAKQLGVVRD